jgi:hypothetical protein
MGSQDLAGIKPDRIFVFMRFIRKHTNVMKMVDHDRAHHRIGHDDFGGVHGTF